MTPAAIQATGIPHIRVPDTSTPHDAKALTASSLAPSGTTVCASKKVSPRLIQIPQCLLLNILRASREPRLSPTSLGQLAALLHKTWRRPASRPVLQPLLVAKVVNEPGVRTMLQQDNLLLSSGVQPVPGHGFTIPLL